MKKKLKDQLLFKSFIKAIIKYATPLLEEYDRKQAVIRYFKNKKDRKTFYLNFLPKFIHTNILHRIYSRLIKTQSYDYVFT